MRPVFCLRCAALAVWLAGAVIGNAAESLDPARIEELSVADASRLVSESPGATVEVPDRSGGKQNVTQALALPRLRTLSPEAAAGLAEFRGNALLLDGLTDVSPETAEALAAFTGPLLSLTGLTEVSPEAAAALIGYRHGRLRLDGLTSLTPEVARALARCEVRSLGLEGVTTLSPEAAAVVMDSAARGVSLAGLAEMIDHPDQKHLFALVVARDRHPLTPSWPVRLGGIEALVGPAGLETARILAAVNRELALPNLKRIAPEAARALAGFKGDTLEMPALVEIDPAAAEALAACPARLVMRGLRQRFGGLPALTAADVPLVRLMSREAVGARLESLASLDTPEAVATARTLAAATTHVVLPRVRRISVAAARELAAFKGDALVLDGLTELSADAAEALAAMQVPQVRLNGLRELSPETAAELARCGIAEVTDLHLDGLTTLSPEAAAALAGFTGNRLMLNGLRNLAPESAESLAAARCPVVSAGIRKQLVELRAVTADDMPLLRLAARHPGPILLTHAATIDSVETATLLAALPMRLVLPGLRQVSPKTLAALVAKDDVLVPRFEAIEFTAEPNGGLTEDFVIPDGFEERQRELWGKGGRPPRP